MYYEKIALATGVFAVTVTLLNAAHRDWKSEAHEAIQHTFANAKILDVDNIDGIIHVLGDGGNTIRVEAEETIHAADQAALDRAKRDVHLDINEKDGVAQLYVNGPFRGNPGGNSASSEYHGFHLHYDDRDYEVAYDFTIHIPRDTELRLRTINGEVKTEQTNGKFDIHGVNGAVTMTAAAGSGAVRVVNGRLALSFRESPKTASEFHSVNGAIEAAFPPNLSADLRFKTVNGQVYTDFDTAAIAQTAASGESRNGKFVYKPDRLRSVRIDAGGPQLDFETVNGDIRIKKEAR
jgi:hypothetical protein